MIQFLKRYRSGSLILIVKMLPKSSANTMAKLKRESHTVWASSNTNIKIRKTMIELLEGLHTSNMVNFTGRHYLYREKTYVL